MPARNPRFPAERRVRRIIGYGNAVAGALCFRPIAARGSEHMKQSTVQFISFLILAAIVLTTGLGAVGVPAGVF